MGIAGRASLKAPAASLFFLCIIRAQFSISAFPTAASAGVFTV
jgi:hypothetical protein